MRLIITSPANLSLITSGKHCEQGVVALFRKGVALSPRLGLDTLTVGYDAVPFMGYGGRSAANSGAPAREPEERP